MLYCLICDRIRLIEKYENPYFVKELETGYVVLGDYQYYQGYTLFLSKVHAPELHLVDENFKKKFLEEMAVVAKAVFFAFAPRKLNYELLGNTDEHMHWHLYPRYSTDPLPNKPIWSLDKSIRCNEETKATKEELELFKSKLLEQLNNIHEEK